MLPSELALMGMTLVFQPREAISLLLLVAVAMTPATAAPCPPLSVLPDEALIGCRRRGGFIDRRPRAAGWAGHSERSQLRYRHPQTTTSLPVVTAQAPAASCLAGSTGSRSLPGRRAGVFVPVAVHGKALDGAGRVWGHPGGEAGGGQGGAAAPEPAPVNDHHTLLRSHGRSRKRPGAGPLLARPELGVVAEEVGRGRSWRCYSRGGDVEGGTESRTRPAGNAGIDEGGTWDDVTVEVVLPLPVRLNKSPFQIKGVPLGDGGSTRM